MPRRPVGLGELAAGRLLQREAGELPGLPAEQDDLRLRRLGPVRARPPQGLPANRASTRRASPPAGAWRLPRRSLALTANGGTLRHADSTTAAAGAHPRGLEPGRRRGEPQPAAGRCPRRGRPPGGGAAGAAPLPVLGRWGRSDLRAAGSRRAGRTTGCKGRAGGFRLERWGWGLATSGNGATHGAPTSSGPWPTPCAPGSGSSSATAAPPAAASPPDASPACAWWARPPCAGPSSPRAGRDHAPGPARPGRGLARPGQRLGHRLQRRQQPEPRCWTGRSSSWARARGTTTRTATTWARARGTTTWPWPAPTAWWPPPPCARTCTGGRASTSWGRPLVRGLVPPTTGSIDGRSTTDDIGGLLRLDQDVLFDPETAVLADVAFAEELNLLQHLRAFDLRGKLRLSPDPRPPVRRSSGGPPGPQLAGDRQHRMRRHARPCACAGPWRPRTATPRRPAPAPGAAT